MKIAILSIFFSFLLMHNSRTIHCVQLAHILMTTLLQGIVFFLFGVAYELRLASYGLETVSNNLFQTVLGLVLMYSGRGTYCQAAPLLPSTPYDEFVGNKLCLSRALTIFLSVYIVYLRVQK